jgi:hypothetical protein
LFKNKYFIETPREPEGEEDRSKPGKRQFWMKLENKAEHGTRLKVWWSTGSDGDASQIPYVSNGRERYITVCY